jgi:hypothetical protein
VSYGTSRCAVLGLVELRVGHVDADDAASIHLEPAMKVHAEPLPRSMTVSPGRGQRVNASEGLAAAGMRSDPRAQPGARHRAHWNGIAARVLWQSRHVLTQIEVLRVEANGGGIVCPDRGLRWARSAAYRM